MSPAAAIALEDIMPPRLGTVDPASHPDEEFDLYSIPAYDAGEPEVAKGRQIGSAKQIVKAGDVLLSRIVPHIRRAWVVGDDRGRRIIASGEWIVFRGPTVVPQYLRHVLVGDPFHAEFMHTVSGVGGSLLRARPAYVAKIRIPVPTLPEQRRIAEILDKADALRTNRRAALAQFETLAQSIFLDMFGEPISNSKGWPTVRFENICERVTVGIVVQPASYYVSYGVPALRSLNIRPGKIVLENLVYFSQTDNDTKLAKTKLKAGDVVLVRTGQPGTAAVVPPELDGVNAIDLLIATPDQRLANPTFLCEFFNSAGGRDLVLSRQRGQVQKHLNVGSLNQAILPLPPIEVQRDFAARIAAVEQKRTALQASSTGLDALFASLQCRAFRGEL